MLEVAAQPSATGWEIKWPKSKKQKPVPKSHMHWAVLKITWCLKKKIQLVTLSMSFDFHCKPVDKVISSHQEGKLRVQGLLSTSLLGQDHVSVVTCTVCHFWAVCGGQLQHHVSGGADAQPCRFIGNLIYYIRNLWKHVRRRPWCFHWGCWSVVTAFSASVSSSLLDSTFLWQFPSLNCVFITTFLLLLLLSETLQALD